MPQHFAHDKDSNNYKLLKIIAENSNENRTTYETMLKYWDVDQSEGVALDRLGKDEGIFRGGWADEEYRKMIKIQCILNLSEGDIDTMNQILDAYMEQGFIGLEDGWDIEPASIIANVDEKATSFPDWLIKRIKPAGVSFYVMFNKLSEFIVINGGTYTWEFNSKITGRFKTASMHAVIGKEYLSIRDESYAFFVPARISGRFRAGGIVK